MLRRLEKEIIKKKLIDENEKVLIGVSGGPDSMALLHALHRLAPKYRWELFVVHIDHQLREESVEDAAYVARCCRELKVPCRIVNVDVKERIEAEGGGVQEVARFLRYQVFEEVAREWDIQKLAVAHHADDQVETILMRLIRGTGTAGLMGMQLRRWWKGKELIRPLLSFTRKEVEAYCHEEHLYPRLDRSNLSVDYMRNRIRIELIPILNTYNPRFREAILQLSEIATEEEKVWGASVSEIVTKLIKAETEESISICNINLLQLPIALQRRTIKLILNSLMKESGETTLHAIDQIRKLALQVNPSGCILLPGGMMAEREYDTLHLHIGVSTYKKNTSKGRAPKINLIPPGVVALPGMMGKIELIQSASPLEKLPSCRDWVVFDLSKIDTPLNVRTRRDGDRMTCYGMKGTKKIKKLFIEEKVPLKLRDQYPIIISSEGQILWIPGVKRSDHALVDIRTNSFLYMLWHVNEIDSG